MNRYVIASQFCIPCADRVAPLQLQGNSVRKLLATFAWHMLLLRDPNSQVNLFFEKLTLVIVSTDALAIE